MMLIFYLSFTVISKNDASKRHTIEICNRFVKNGHIVYLIVPSSKKKDALLDQKIRIVPIPKMGWIRIRALTSLGFYLAVPWFVAHLFLRLKPDIVYSRFSFLDFIAIAPLRMVSRFLYVAEINGIRSIERSGTSIRRQVIAWCEKVSLLLCDRAIGVTPELSEWAIQKGNLSKSQSTSISNGVNTETFRPMSFEAAKRQLGLDESRRYLTFTGSFKEWHAVRVLIDAMPIINDALSGKIQLLMVGNGPGRDVLIELSRRTSIDVSVSWIGEVGGDMVPLYINSGEVCVAPFSLKRNRRVGISPLKIFEYMACGRPIVTTRLGISFDEIMNACGCSVLVEPDDPKAFARAVVELLDNTEKAQKMGSLGRQFAVEKFSWGAVADQSLKFVNEGVK